MMDDDFRIMQWIDETCMRHLERIHRTHGGTEDVLRSKKFDRFICVALLVTIIFFHRVQMCLLSWSTGTFISLVAAWLSVMFTLFELAIVNTICLVCKIETMEFRERLIAQLEAYAEPA